MNNKYLIIFAIALITTAITACKTSYNYIKVNSGEIFYKDNDLKHSAEKLADYLNKISYLDGKPTSILLAHSTSDEDAYTVGFVVNKSKLDSTVDYAYKIMSPLLSYNVFDGATVNIDLLDNDLNRIKTYKGFNFGKLIKFGDDDLYYTSKIDEKTAKKLGYYLIDTKFFSGTGRNAQITKENNTYQFKFNVKEGMEKDKDYLSLVKSYAILLSRDVFNNAPIEIHLCDNLFNTLVIIDGK